MEKVPSVFNVHAWYLAEELPVREDPHHAWVVGWRPVVFLDVRGDPEEVHEERDGLLSEGGLVRDAVPARGGASHCHAYDRGVLWWHPPVEAADESVGQITQDVGCVGVVVLEVPPRVQLSERWPLKICDGEGPGRLKDLATLPGRRNGQGHAVILPLPVRRSGCLAPVIWRRRAGGQDGPPCACGSTEYWHWPRWAGSS